MTDPTNNKGIHSSRKTPPLPTLRTGLQFKLAKVGQKKRVHLNMQIQLNKEQRQLLVSSS